MIFGVVGAHAIGKTIFVLRYRQSHSDVPYLRCIHGDLTTDNYPLAPEYADSRYYRDLEFKRRMLTDMMYDRRTLWLVEGCRFWGSMFHHLAPVVRGLGGGLFMLVVTTTRQILFDNMVERAKVNKRTLKVGYWTESKLDYEARARHVNACSKWLGDDDWYCVHFDGDFDLWNREPLMLLDAFVEDKSLWYRRFPVMVERVST